MKQQDLAHFKRDVLAKQQEEIKKFSSELAILYRRKGKVTIHQLNKISLYFRQYYSYVESKRPTTFYGHHHHTTLHITNPIKNISLPYTEEAQNQCYFELLQQHFIPLIGYFKYDLINHCKELYPDLDVNNLREILSFDLPEIINTNSPRAFASMLYPAILNGRDGLEYDDLKLALWTYYSIHSIDDFSKVKLDARFNRHTDTKSRHATMFWTLDQIGLILKLFNPKITPTTIKKAVSACVGLNLFQQLKNNKLGDVYRVRNSESCIEEWLDTTPWAEQRAIYGRCHTIVFGPDHCYPSHPDKLLYQLVATDVEYADLISYRNIQKFWGISNQTIKDQLPKYAKVIRNYSKLSIMKNTPENRRRQFLLNPRSRYSKSNEQGYCWVYQIESHSYRCKVPYHIVRQTFHDKLTRVLHQDFHTLPLSLKKLWIAYLPSVEEMEEEVERIGESEFKRKNRISSDEAIHTKMRLPSHFVPSATRTLKFEKAFSKGQRLPRGSWKRNHLFHRTQVEHKVKSKRGESFVVLGDRRTLPPLNRPDINNADISGEIRPFTVISKKYPPKSSKTLKTTPCLSLVPTKTPSNKSIVPSLDVKELKATRSYKRGATNLPLPTYQ